MSRVIEVLIVLVGLLGLIINGVVAQEPNEVDYLEKMYQITLSEYIADEIQVENDSIVYFDTQNYSVKLPNKVLNVKIIDLNGSNFRKIYRKNSNTLIHTRFTQAKIYGNTIEISIIPFIGRMKRRRLDLAQSTSYTCVFKLNCDKNQWVLAEQYGSGI